ncbi:MAG: methylmalonyl-CoA epimerase [Chitinophagales bacterium]
MKKIEHIGIAVKDLEASNAIYEKLLGVSSYKQEEVVSENVMTSFFKIGQSKIELLQATSKDSAIHKFIEKKGEGFHHIAFSVSDIEFETKRLISEGFKPLMEKPKKGADNKLVMFFHPKTTGGMLVELCQEIK